MKLSRIKKLTWKLFLVYTMVMVGIFLADPDPRQFLRPYFWAGAAVFLFGEWVRMWASGHLVKNKILTVTGPYAYVKNPLYIGTFLLMIGCAILGKGDDAQPHWYLRFANWILLAAGILLFVFYYVPYKKRREGDRLHDLFGADWDHYDQNVPDYFPRLTRYERAQPRPWSWRTVCDNSEHWAPLAIVAGAAALVFNGFLLDLVRKVAR